MIARFVDASTIDGFNPYRVTREGFDWEVLDPGSPWSGIGYWGDHQVVYLHRLLESACRHLPGAIEGLLDQECFSWADVPYRLEPYAAILAEPRRTIRYDHARAADIAAREGTTGRDARLVRAADGSVARASLLEKLLVPVLAKLSNLVPDGGIWMNTERPEWNDANNALVGNGLSVVTLCQLRAHLRFLEVLVGRLPSGSARVSAGVAEWLRRVTAVLESNRGALDAPQVDDRARRRVMDALGLAFEHYREQAYANGPGAKQPLAGAVVLRAFAAANEWLDHAIRANRRPDGLYHSYNLLDAAPAGDTASVRRLGVMLEGQVAALGSGLVEPAEAVRLVETLFASELYREDARSFLLYPARTLPGFLERNSVPESRAQAVPLLVALLASGDASLVERDAAGTIRFHADFRNAGDVALALDRLANDPAWAGGVARDARAVVETFVDVFGHRTYTGRSGTMYAYEGLGSIYWHMVAKLLLAVQELAVQAADRDEPADVRRALADAYYRIRSGFGFEKSAEEFGAFPTDPYSHTPAHAGAQQPGMTGEVKEEILTRLGEFGVAVDGGRVRFRPVLLRAEEFLAEPSHLRAFGLDGAPLALDVPADAFAFTFAQVPVFYTRSRGPASLRVTWRDGREQDLAGNVLDADASAALLGRTGDIVRLDVAVPDAAVLDD